MAKTPTPDFETTLKELETIVSHLESGDLPLEEALSEFETAVKLVKQGQERLQKAEQRIKILLDKNENAPLENYAPTAANARRPTAERPSENPLNDEIPF